VVVIATAMVRQEEDEEEVIAAGEFVEGLPEYSNEELKKHTSPETGIWVPMISCSLISHRSE